MAFSLRLFARAAAAGCILVCSNLSAIAGQAHFLMDAGTGRVLEEENADELNYPASLTKMMTLYLTFEALHKGTLTWDTKLTMSENANGKEPFKFAIGVGKQVTVREAVQGIVVLSANDAAAVLGEKLAGTEDAFGKMMTEKAHQLGMVKTTFKNATGLPDPEQVTTARDLSLLALSLIRDYPQDYKLFSMRYIQFRSMKLRGHNNLMKRYDGVDGIKTGYTIASGYNLVSSVNRGSTRLIGVVMGGKTAASRDDDMAALFDRYLPKAGPGLAGAEPSPLSPKTAAH